MFQVVGIGVPRNVYGPIGSSPALSSTRSFCPSRLALTPAVYIMYQRVPLGPVSRWNSKAQKLQHRSAAVSDQTCTGAAVLAAR